MPLVILPCLYSEVQSPPDADILHGAYPLRRVDDTGVVEIEDEWRVDESHGFAGYLHGPPWCHDAVAGIACLDPVGPWCEVGLEDSRRGAPQGHLGIVCQRGFVDAGIGAPACLESHRCVGRGDGGKGHLAVFQLVGVEVGRDGPRHCAVGNGELRQLVGHDYRVGAGHGVGISESEPVVKQLERQCEPYAVAVVKADCHGIVAVTDFLVFAPRLVPYRV